MKGMEKQQQLEEAKGTQSVSTSPASPAPTPLNAAAALSSSMTALVTQTCMSLSPSSSSPISPDKSSPLPPATSAALPTHTFHAPPSAGFSTPTASGSTSCDDELKPDPQPGDASAPSLHSAAAKTDAKTSASTHSCVKRKHREEGEDLSQRITRYFIGEVSRIKEALEDGLVHGTLLQRSVDCGDRVLKLGPLCVLAGGQAKQDCEAVYQLFALYLESIRGPAPGYSFHGPRRPQKLQAACHYMSACIMLDNEYSTVLGHDKQIAGSTLWQAIKLGDTRAHFLTGKTNETVNPPAAVKSFQTGASHLDVPSMVRMSELYATGEAGLTANPEKRVAWMYSAALNVGHHEPDGPAFYARLLIDDHIGHDAFRCRGSVPDWATRKAEAEYYMQQALRYGSRLAKMLSLQQDSAPAKRAKSGLDVEFSLD